MSKEVECLKVKIFTEDFYNVDSLNRQINEHLSVLAKSEIYPQVQFLQSSEEKKTHITAIVTWKIRDIH